ncbi:MAG: hypothetical protein JWQ83_1790, partial [Lacunisphaera sp.]|nr:hypothetical protein [Lacunisphaera sp.]
MRGFVAVESGARELGLAVEEQAAFGDDPVPFAYAGQDFNVGIADAAQLDAVGQVGAIALLDKDDRLGAVLENSGAGRDEQAG